MNLDIPLEKFLLWGYYCKNENDRFYWRKTKGICYVQLSSLLHILMRSTFGSQILFTNLKGNFIAYS